MIGLLASLNVIASECGLLELQQNRSSKVSIRGSECAGNILSSGATLKLAAKGRAWLKPLVHLSPLKFNLICQNKTRHAISIEFSDQLLPWLNTAKLNNCTGWDNNILKCHGNQGEKDGLICVFSSVRKSLKPKQIERTTSVKMRSLQFQSLNTSYQEVMLADIEHDLQLCKQINDEFDEEVQIHWMLEPNFSVRMVGITLYKQQDQSLANCAKSVIMSYPFTRVSETKFFSRSF